MDELFFLGQVICLGAFGYGAFLCITNAGLGDAEGVLRELPPEARLRFRVTRYDPRADAHIAPLLG
jgi:hypothetical protein